MQTRDSQERLALLSGEELYQLGLELENEQNYSSALEYFLLAAQKYHNMSELRICSHYQTDASVLTFSMISMRYEDFGMDEKIDDVDLLQDIKRINLFRCGQNNAFQGYGFFVDPYFRDFTFESHPSVMPHRYGNLLKSAMINAIDEYSSDYVLIPVSDVSIAANKKIFKDVVYKFDIVTVNGREYTCAFIDRQIYKDNKKGLLTRFGVTGIFLSMEEQIDIAVNYQKHFDCEYSIKNITFALNPFEFIVPAIKDKQSEVELSQDYYEDISLHLRFLEEIFWDNSAALFYIKLISKIIDNLTSDYFVEVDAGRIYEPVEATIGMSWQRLATNLFKIPYDFDNLRDFMLQIEFIFEELILINKLLNKFDDQAKILSVLENFAITNYEIDDELQGYMHARIGASGMQIIAKDIEVTLSNCSVPYKILLENDLYFEESLLVRWLLSINLNKNPGADENKFTLYHLDDAATCYETYNIAETYKINYEVDVAICGFRENVSLFDHNLIVFNVSELISNQLKIREKNLSDKKLTIIIDTTLSSFDDQDLCELLILFDREIINGKLAVICGHSLNKYFHMGIDKLPAGIGLGFFNDECFPHLVELYRRKELNPINVTYPMIALLMKDCSDFILMYHQMVIANSRFVYEEIISQELIQDSSDSTISIASPYPVFNKKSISTFILIQIKTTNELLLNFLSNTLCQLMYKFDLKGRDGFGFFKTTFTTWSTEKGRVMRLSLGVESKDELKEKILPLVRLIEHLNFLMEIIHTREPNLSDNMFVNCINYYADVDVFVQTEIPVKFYLKKILREFALEYDLQDQQARLCIIADAYLSGRGVPQNNYFGIKFYIDAALNGSVEAVYRLGICCYFGKGVLEDKEMAKELIFLASDFGHAVAGFRGKQLFGLEFEGDFTFWRSPVGSNVAFITADDKASACNGKSVSINFTV